jgi:drug/metabolite transporter (DMT)-like permease
MTKPYFALISGIVLIGISPILIKMAEAPGIVTSFYRMAFGALTLIIPFAILLKRKRFKLSTKGIGWALLGGICFASDMALWSTGIVASNATLPTIVANLAPVWVGFGAMIFFHEKQPVGFWFGLFLAITGMVLLTSNDIFESNTLIVKGIFLGLFAGMFYASYQLFTQIGRKKLDTLSYLFISSLSAAISLGIIIPILNMEYFGYPNQTWLLWIIMGVGMQAGAWFLINYAQGFIPASIVSPSMLIQPFLTGIIAVGFLNEKLTLWHISGGIIMLTGVFLIHFLKRNNE